MYSEINKHVHSKRINDLQKEIKKRKIRQMTFSQKKTIPEKAHIEETKKMQSELNSLVNVYQE